jgi:sialate O-acetylesterase
VAPLLRPFDAATDPARQAELARKISEWEAKSFPQDTGNRGEARGWARGRDAHGWVNMELPQPWEDAGLKIDGVVWFRRDVIVPPSWAGRDLALSLGAIDDFDVTYWNGERVGATGTETPRYWAAPRRYTVPARLVKPGHNLIAVRVFDHYGTGGFVGTSAQMRMEPVDAPPGGTTAYDISGPWSYKIERRLDPVNVDFSTRPPMPGPDDPTAPTVLWNGMVAPLAGLAAEGVIWYQGEGNTSRAYQYRTLFPAMIRAWRAAWHDSALPFLFVQLPNYGAPGGARAALGDSEWAELREAQAMTLRQPRTAMAVTLDIGESDNLHPRNKQEVGRRLALAALSSVYRQSDIASGPIFQSVTRDGNAMRVRFAPGGSGLDTADGAPPRGFLIAGADRVWHAATARIDGKSVIVSSRDVPDPVAVRYGWANDPQATLRNQADLPAAPFRTDDWPAITAAAAGP